LGGGGERSGKDRRSSEISLWGGRKKIIKQLLRPLEQKEKTRIFHTRCQARKAPGGKGLSPKRKGRRFLSLKGKPFKRRKVEKDISN